MKLSELALYFKHLLEELGVDADPVVVVTPGHHEQSQWVINDVQIVGDSIAIVVPAGPDDL